MKLARRFESQDKRIRGTPRDVGTLCLVKIVALSYIDDVAVIFYPVLNTGALGKLKTARRVPGL